jgi:mannosyltransferase OCH1-like enzyme
MNQLRVPRNIFQTWKTKNISNHFKYLIQTWKDNNPNYTYFLFDDDDCETFIKQNFEESVYKAYCRIIPGAFKADLWRYCILYIYGGIYVDIDTICLNSIDSFLDENIEFMTPIDLNNCRYYGTYNLFNCFIASIPRHPILMECIKRIVNNVENNNVPFSNLDFSGPGILGKSTNCFIGNNENETFIGKEGIHNKTLKFLKFEYGTEYVKDIDNNNILFQNKNGNKLISDIYENEVKNIDYICWGTCKNPIKQIDNTNNNNTIVTMFYKIREKENNTTNSKLNHSVNRYVELAKNFILKLPYNLIIFTDDQEIINLINEERQQYSDKTLIINKPFEDSYYYKHLDRLRELQKIYIILNGHIEHETPMYIILNNNKFDFIEEAIKLNPFKSSHFIWMDFAINHVALNCEKIHEWITRVPDKIKQLCINPYIENIDNKDMFKYIYHHIAGGLFTGSSANLLKYCQLFKEKTEEIYNENWYQIDEAVMTMVLRENPEMVELFYGDYKGIISNYITPIHDIDLILTAAQKYINYNKTKEAFSILCYCHNYFEKNINSPSIFDYIQKHIIVDYYNNNKILLDNVISLIKVLKSTNKDKINKLIQLNETNINFYLNKKFILEN